VWKYAPDLSNVVSTMGEVFIILMLEKAYPGNRHGSGIMCGALISGLVSKARWDSFRSHRDLMSVSLVYELLAPRRLCLAFIPLI